MKKILISLIYVFSLLVAIPVSAKEDLVPVYMFSKDGCSACISASQFFEDLESEYPNLFEVIEIVVFDENWQEVDNDRKELLIKVYDRFNEDSGSASTPTIVIGDYHSLGLPGDTNVIYDEIMNYKNNEKAVDEVKKIIDELELDIEDLKVYESSNTNTVQSESSGKYDAIIVVGIFVVLIGGLAALVVLGKK